LPSGPVAAYMRRTVAALAALSLGLRPPGAAGSKCCPPGSMKRRARADGGHGHSGPARPDPGAVRRHDRRL